MGTKRRPLVTQHLENISREALERYQGILRAYIRNRQGVYALYRKGKLYYIGLAGNLRSRLTAHLRDRHKESWDRFSVYLTIGVDHMKELESLILRVVKPAGNKVKGKFAKSESLLPALRRDLRRQHAAEDQLLFGSSHRVARRVAKEKRRSESASNDEGRKPILAKYPKRPTVLRARHKGKVLQARVRRDGSISYAGKVYNSPSVAGAVAVGRISCNGWTFWSFERSPGDWVRLEELRRR